MIVAIIAKKTRIDAADQGLNRSLVDQVLVKDFGFVGGGSVKHVDEQVAAVLGHAPIGDVGRPIVLAENFDVLSRIATQLVKAHVRRILAHQRVIKAALVGQKRNREIASTGQYVRQRFACIHVKQVNFGFILAAMANAIGEQAAILAHAADIDTHGVISAHRLGINQDLVIAGQALSHVNHIKILIGAPLTEEI